MTMKLGTALGSLATSLLWSTNAFAACAFGVCDNVVPEIDGPGVVMAVALLVSLGIMIYRKAQK